MQRMPYFMTNEEWYFRDYDDDERGYKLTDKAPQEAVESYNEFYGGTVELKGDAKEAFASYQFD